MGDEIAVQTIRLTHEPPYAKQRNKNLARERHLQHRINELKLTLLKKGDLMTDILKASQSESDRLRKEIIEHKHHKQYLDSCSTCRSTKAFVSMPKVRAS
jgi:hypothetical protein